MTVPERLNKLRAAMNRRDIDAYLIVTDDFHGSEYVGDHFKTRAYFSGFTGSAGTLLVLSDAAYLWTDGRYFLQAEDQLNGTGVRLMKQAQPGVPTVTEFLKEHLPEHGALGFDGRTVTCTLADSLKEALREKEIRFSVGEDLAEGIWEDRPPLSAKPIWELGTEYAGMSREEKIELLRKDLSENGANAQLLTALDDIAWTLNLRGDDVECTPVFLSYLLITNDRAILFVQKKELSDSIREALDRAKIETEEYSEISRVLARLPEQTVLMFDPSTANSALRAALSDGVCVIEKESPAMIRKSVKTEAEQEHFRLAHRKDGVALTRFIYWLKHAVANETVTECSAAVKLEEFRKGQDGYLGQSFDPIIAFAQHGAIVHYSATEETDAKLEPRSFCLADTGGHYIDGSTDVTRTVSLGVPTDEEKRAYTLVLRGHLALAAAVFQPGLCGANLDILARTPLWEEGLDFNHGTGHGVGYLLSVHEGPQRIHWRFGKNGNPPLEVGMVTSNEPGYYEAGKFGVRIENLILTREKTGDPTLRYFETLTLVPYDRDAVDPTLMSDREIRWFNDYQQRVYREISPYLPEPEREWLKSETAPIGK